MILNNILAKRTEYEIEIKHYAFIRAIQRGISPDLIEKCVKNGRIKRYGKNYVKIISKSIICVGEIITLKMKILTIEKRK